MQLGLILALLFTYGILEFQFEKKTATLCDFNYDPEQPQVYAEMPTFKIKRKTKPVKVVTQKKKTPVIDIIKKVDNDKELAQKVLKPEDPTEDNLNDAIEGLPNITEPTEDVPQPFILIEQAPIFPGCEGLNKKASKACFTKQISKFVNKKFNTNVAEELGLIGKQKIYVQFVIDKEGKVSDIITNSSYKGLEKEALRVIEQLPQMTPGMQRERPVSVKYTLPIKFLIN